MTLRHSYQSASALLNCQLPIVRCPFSISGHCQAKQDKLGNVLIQQSGKNFPSFSRVLPVQYLTVAIPTRWWYIHNRAKELPHRWYKRFAVFDVNNWGFAPHVGRRLTWHGFWRVMSSERFESKQMSSDPVVLGIILSDFVIREAGTNKLSLIGCFNMYNSPGFPFLVPPFVATVILTNFRGKFTKPKTVTLRIEDCTNALVMANVTGMINAPPEHEFTGIEVMEMPFPMTPFQIFHAGPYSVDVLIDGEKVGSRAVQVLSFTASPLPPQKT